MAGEGGRQEVNQDAGGPTDANRSSNGKSVFVASPPATEAETDESRIYLLGTGSIGKLVAHSLRGLPDPPPVTLLFHRGYYRRIWNQSSKEIVLTTQGVDVARSGIDVELARVGWRRGGRSISYEGFSTGKYTEDAEPDVELPDAQNKTPIKNLIVSVKAPSTVGALLAVKQRLTPSSTILFLQNGMGIVDKVNEEVFPDPETRPHYMQGIITHGVHSKDLLRAVHAGLGTIALCVLPRPDHPNEPYSARYLMRTLSRSPVLAAAGFPYEDFIQRQLQKLAVNAVINPVTSLLDGPNGIMYDNFALTRVTRLLLAEISLVIRSLPELQSLPNVERRFRSGELERAVEEVANATRNNISSMLADVRDGARTEIEYINGYIVKRGEELGIKCVMNYMIMQLVKGKQVYIKHERDAQLPMSYGESFNEPIAARNRGSEDDLEGEGEGEVQK